MSEKIRKDIHIEILKYAQKHTEFRLRQLMEKLHFNQNEKNLLSQNIIHSKSLLDNTSRTETTQYGEEDIYTISTEGRFRLLDHQQLRSARRFGIIAILFSVAVAVATTGMQIAYPTKVSEQQFNEVKNINIQLQDINTKIQAIEVNQTSTIKAIEHFENTFKSVNKK